MSRRFNREIIQVFRKQTILATHNHITERISIALRENGWLSTESIQMYRVYKVLEVPTIGRQVDRATWRKLDPDSRPWRLPWLT